MSEVVTQVATQTVDTKRLTRVALTLSIISAVILTVILIAKFDIDVFHRPPLAIPLWLAMTFKGVSITTTVLGFIATAISLYVRWITRKDKKVAKTLRERLGDQLKETGLNAPSNAQSLPQLIGKWLAGQGVTVTLSVVVLGVAIVTTTVVLIAPTQPITEIALPSTSKISNAITSGPDGAIWYGGRNAIGRLDPTTDVAQTYPFTPPATAQPNPVGIVGSMKFDRSRNLWFVVNFLNRLSTMDMIAEFALSTHQFRFFPQKIAITNIVLGSDGAMWFVDYTEAFIDRIDVAGQVTSLSNPDPTCKSTPTGICDITTLTVGPDSALWFTEPCGNKIGRVTLGGQTNVYPLPHGLQDSANCGGPSNEPDTITSGQDGNLWFTEDHADQIGRLTPSGVFTEFKVPSPDTNYLGNIIAGPDGNVWFTEPDAKKLALITPSGAITEYRVLSSKANLGDLTMGPDGAIWFTEGSINQLGRHNP